MRYFFEISYKGTDYHGWQRQVNAISVQEVVEDGLSLILRRKIEITGSGRTDAGVHCHQQFFHVDLTDSLPELFKRKINALLPPSISINNIYKVTDESHARFDAISRTYKYQIQRVKEPFAFETTMQHWQPIDIDKMNKAARLLIGEKDFKCFSKVKTDVFTFVCSITKANWEMNGNVLTFTVEANRFLRGMVRAIVGTLLEVGQNKRTIEEFENLIESGDRTKAGSAAPAKGLSLIEVKYPDKYFIVE